MHNLTHNSCFVLPLVEVKSGSFRTCVRGERQGIGTPTVSFGRCAFSSRTLRTSRHNTSPLRKFQLQVRKTQGLQAPQGLKASKTSATKRKISKNEAFQEAEHNNLHEHRGGGKMVCEGEGRMSSFSNRSPPPSGLKHREAPPPQKNGRKKEPSMTKAGFQQFPPPPPTVVVLCPVNSGHSTKKKRDAAPHHGLLLELQLRVK